MLLAAPAPTRTLATPAPIIGAAAAAAGATAPAARAAQPNEPRAAGAAQADEGVARLDAYYAPAEGKTGAQLLHALHEVVRRGHVDRGYAQARDELFDAVDDVDGDDRVPDLFTGEQRGPITNRSQAFDLGFNTEHTWPQSKGATGVAQSDLHHLRPADIRTNERRSSLPYGEVVTPEWSVGEGASQARLGVDALGTKVFEPHAAVKGDVARGLLYFYTRYFRSQPAKFTTENFAHELQTLLRWHAQDPVSADERARNDAVQLVQGNRNPYVDRPEFVAAVGFAQLDLGRGAGRR